MSRFLLTLATIILITGSGTGTATASEFEPSRLEVTASSVLGADLLKGRYHSVDEQVVIDGYMHHYSVSSDFGRFTAIGDLALKKLLHELDAIAELRKRSATDAGTDAVAGVVTDTGDSLVRIAADPAGTAQGIGGGVSRFFKRTKRSAENLADTASDTVKDDEKDKEQADEESDIDEAEVAQQVAESYLGVGEAQRELARELGVDPYSRNEVLQDELHRVAQISGTVGKVTKMLLPMPAMVSAAQNVSNLVWSLSPTDLLIQNEETMQGLGYRKKEIKTFFSNRAFTPTQQTAFVAALESLDEVNGRELFLDMAGEAQTCTEGEFVIQSILFYQLYHENHQPLEALARTPDGVLPLAITANDALLFAPLDYMTWTEEIATGTARVNSLLVELGITAGKQLWVEGRISPVAETHLNEAGWADSTGGFKKLKAMIGGQ